MYRNLYLAMILCSVSSFAATFQSPNGVTEECRIIPHLAAGKYDIEDSEDEQKLCGIDFYAQNKIALCPKTWSTSPGTMVYDISASNLNQRDYEAQASCGGSKAGHEKITKFKQTMNASGTSGTFAASGLLYYHFSRYFDTSVKVPVTVYRSMDRQAHFDRVTNKAFTKNMGKGPMNKAGWKTLFNAEKTPSTYRPVNELFTADQKQIWGFIGDLGGTRYGPEINGIRSRWGDAQNLDFQETPGFLALRSEKPLKEAIAEGLSLGSRDAKIKQAMGPGASDFQVAVWMKELSEIALLDHIFSQQDRIGNIDYKWYVYYTDSKGRVKSDKLDDEVSRTRMDSIRFALKGTAGVELVQRTRLIDNDAGAKENYTNFTKRTKMLEKIRHLAPETYKKLIDLDKDFASQGDIFNFVKGQFGLSDTQTKKIAENARDAAAILKSTCKSGKLRFDLAGVKAQFKGGIQPVTLDCDNP